MGGSGYGGGRCDEMRLDCGVVVRCGVLCVG